MTHQKRVYRVLKTRENSLAEFRRVFHIPQVNVGIASHGGVLDLDGNLLTCCQVAMVHLSEGGTAHRIFIYFSKNSTGVNAKVFFDHTLKHRKGDRSQLIPNINKHSKGLPDIASARLHTPLEPPYQEWTQSGQTLQSIPQGDYSEQIAQLLLTHLKQSFGTPLIYNVFHLLFFRCPIFQLSEGPPIVKNNDSHCLCKICSTESTLLEIRCFYSTILILIPPSTDCPSSSRGN